MKDGSLYLSQSTYINHILKIFNTIHTHPLTTPMVGRGSKNDLLKRHCEKKEKNIK